MGFAPFGAAATVGQVSLLPCVLEFGPGYVDGWLLRHVLVETGNLRPSPTSAATNTGSGPRRPAGCVLGNGRRWPCWPKA
jgi:hypothetical protein